jgi:preprotein translocase subunit SecD
LRGEPDHRYFANAARFARGFWSNPTRESMHNTFRSIVFSAVMITLLPVTAEAQKETSQTTPPAFFQIRIASEAEKPDHDRMRMALGESSVYVSRSTTVADDAVIRMRATHAENGLVLDVTLSSEGAQRLAAATRSQVGQHLAVLLNSELVSAAPIVSPLGNGRLLVGAQLPPEKAAQVQAKIAERWPH